MAKQSPEQIALDTLVQELKRELVPILSIPRVWLDEGQAADYLRLSVFSLRAWRSRGGGPAFYRVKSKILYGIEDLDLWVKQHRVSGNSK